MRLNTDWLGGNTLYQQENISCCGAMANTAVRSGEISSESSDESLKAQIIADEREIRIERCSCLLRRIVVQTFSNKSRARLLSLPSPRNTPDCTHFAPAAADEPAPGTTLPAPASPTAITPVIVT